MGMSTVLFLCAYARSRCLVELVLESCWSPFSLWVQGAPLFPFGPGSSRPPPTPPSRLLVVLIGIITSNWVHLAGGRVGYPLKVDYSRTYYECTSRENTEREVPLRPREHDVRRIRVSHLASHELPKNGTVVSAFDLGGRFVAVAENK
jgi:hypothetical protein